MHATVPFHGDLACGTRVRKGGPPTSRGFQTGDLYVLDPHHAGHGIGLLAQEAPRIIPGSDDVFEVGDVFKLERGLYTERCKAESGSEDNYVLRESGLENLFDYPLKR